MTVDEIRPLLRGWKNGSRPKQYKALCPAHDDHNPSLSITETENGHVLVRCWTGCSQTDIARALNVSEDDLKPSIAAKKGKFQTNFTTKRKNKTKPKEDHGKLLRTDFYKYTDIDGNFIRTKKMERYEDGTKDPSWLEEKHGDQTKCLYNLPCVKTADTIFLVEGEKDVETLKACDRAAVSVPNGANSNWLEEYTEYLKGKNVIVIQDNDEPGKKLAIRECDALTGQAASVKLVDLSRLWQDIPEHGDITDYCQTQKDHNPIIKSVETMVAGLPEYQKQKPVDPFLSKFKSLDEFTEEETNWLIPYWIPEGQITLFTADGGVGKTTTWCELIANISNGTPTFLDSSECKREPGKVMFLTTEDSVRKKLRRKLREAGANLKNIITPDFMDDKDGILKGLDLSSEKMNSAIRAFKPVLCVFDPVQGFIPADVNMGSRNEMRHILAPLINIGEECKTAFLIVSHSNKRKGAFGRDRIADSADLWDASRSVMMAGYTEEQGIRYLSNEKNNYAELQQTVLFTINENGRLEKVGTSWKRDREYMQEYSVAQSPSKREDCKEFILHSLGEAGGKMSVKELEESGKNAGYSYATIKRAKDELKDKKDIKYHATGFGKEKTWYIELYTLEQIPDDEIKTG